jgi:hypothetical protein
VEAAVSVEKAEEIAEMKKRLEADGTTAVRSIAMDSEGGVSVDFYDPEVVQSIARAAVERVLLSGSTTADGEWH